MNFDTHPTPIRREKLTFGNAAGQHLAALLETPETGARAFALFAHCFTCSKDVAAASRISRALAGHGIATLRFDFTGLGNSDGDFSNTNFSSNVDDLVAAAEHLRIHYQAPKLLVGHSLGGAAVLAAAERIPQAEALVTIGAPADPGHVSHLFAASHAAIEREGSAEVMLAGRRFTIKKQFLDDLNAQNLSTRIAGLGKALLIFHSPVDEIVSIDNAAAIYTAARHPKSFISLDKADHLLSRAADSQYVAATIAAWSQRYVLSDPETSDRPQLAEGEVLVCEQAPPFSQDVYSGRHHLLADEPISAGGRDLGPSPYDYLLAGLGACTSMTLRLYAERKKIPLRQVQVRLHHEKIHARDCASCDTKSGMLDSIERSIRIVGDISDEQRSSLMAIADRCPVHRSLNSEVRIDTRAEPD